jgi:SAM-dependent methyltransferase
VKFYANVISKALATGRISNKDSALAVCAGPHDRNSYLSNGFEDVVISNVGDYFGNEFSPYKWMNIDAENIPLPDKSVDIVSVHGGLHHCFSPHRAMLEMYRVARKAVICMEARDSLVMRLAINAGLTVDYEIEGITGADHSGGAGGGHIPNFVYRWTEREIRKTVASFEPRKLPQVDFHYDLLLPTQRLAGSNRKSLAMALKAATPVAKLFQTIFPKQGNRFGWVIWKDDSSLQPWLTPATGDNGDVMINMDYVRAKGREFVREDRRSAQTEI